jgi:hypothetical protein
MNMHKKFGTLFGAFCLLMLVWHSLTPDSPHHAINMALHSSMCIGFFVSTLFSIKAAKWIHPALMLIGAGLTSWAGNFTVSATISFVAYMLHYAYGGFNSISLKKIVSSFVLLFVMFFVSVYFSKYGASYSHAYGIALVWTGFTVGLFWAVWIGFENFAKDIIRQNRDLLELTKKLSKGACEDVATKRR